MKQPVIGCDLDGTLAFYDKWRGSTHIGEPIPAMVKRVKDYISQGHEVVIFTARMAPDDELTPEDIEEQRKAIKAWCLRNIGQELEPTCVKSRNIVHYLDDRASGVVPNSGEIVGPEPIIQPHPFPNGMPK